jgi:hypothetical protein
MSADPPFLPPAKPGPSTGALRQKMLVAAGAVAVVAVLAFAGLMLLRPKAPTSNVAAAGAAAPATALTRASGPTGPQTLIGGWEVNKVAWDPQVARNFAGVPLGELWAAKVSAGQTRGTFNLDDGGNAETVVEIDDYGFVTAQGGAFRFKSDDGAVAVVTMARRGPGVSVGGQPGETGFLLMSGATPESWSGFPPNFADGPVKDLVGNWRSASWPARGGLAQTASLVISADGRYNLKLVQVVKGDFKAAADGSWSETPHDPATGAAEPPVTGSYHFSGPDQVTVTTAGEGVTVWDRGQ